jgi:hypothetical protein
MKNRYRYRWCGWLGLLALVIALALPARAAVDVSFSSGTETAVDASVPGYDYAYQYDDYLFAGGSAWWHDVISIAYYGGSTWSVSREKWIWQGGQYTYQEQFSYNTNSYPYGLRGSLSCDSTVLSRKWTSSTGDTVSLEVSSMTKWWARSTPYSVKLVSSGSYLTAATLGVNQSDHGSWSLPQLWEQEHPYVQMNNSSIVTRWVGRPMSGAVDGWLIIDIDRRIRSVPPLLPY